MGILKLLIYNFYKIRSSILHPTVCLIDDVDVQFEVKIFDETAWKQNYLFSSLLALTCWAQINHNVNKSV